MARKYFFILFGLTLLASSHLYPQSINSGTVSGTVTDPSGAVVSEAKVRLRNHVTGYDQSGTTDSTGSFRFNSIPQNNYQLTITAPGFGAVTQDLDVRSSLPINLNIAMKVAAGITTVEVGANGAQVETDPSAHQDVDRSMFMKLPTFNPAGSLSEAVV